MKRIAEPIETKDLCSYGCGLTAKFINASKNLMCDISHSKCPELRRKNSEGAKKAHSLETVSRYKKMSEESKIRMNWNKNNFNADFSYNGKGSHKKVLILERGHRCESCNLESWFNEPIPLELEHCDGVNVNNTKENLLLLCPNCHAKTRFCRGRNKNNGKIKVSDKNLLTSLKKHSNIRQALIEVGLTPKGGNYKRAKKLWARGEIG
ncbi:HNHc domain containing protein [uncultured Caudovirales phage]|uniref:HNHc domain containing protein n=1 Tax=uncultured Caudovirales phage TaxID=2100421 RepID=A0A6J5P0W5_9CAUD|nr:HNHc domain containing protein [uncultured Caudovirales phage]